MRHIKIVTIFSILLISGIGAAKQQIPAENTVRVGDLYFSVLSEEAKTAVCEGNMIIDQEELNIDIPARIIFTKDDSNTEYTVTAISDEAFTDRLPGWPGDIYQTDYCEHDRARCCNLQSVTFPETIINIGSEAFAGARILEKVEIPPYVTEIGSNCFYWSGGLKKIILPETLMEIPEGFASMCKNLAECEIPQSTVIIGDNAFFRCNSLTHVFIPASVKEIGKDAFTALVSIENFEVDPENESYCTWEGILFNKDMTLLVAWPFTRRHVAVPEGVQKIYGEALNWGFELVSLDLPSSIETLENTSFNYDTQLKDIIIRTNIPPVGNDEKPMFAEEVFRNATLHVPQEALELYFAAPIWSKFSKIVAIGISDVDKIAVDEHQHRFYTLDGQETHIPRQGQIVIRCNNRKTEKIVY